MQQKGGENIQRKPGRIAKRCQPGAGQEFANGVDVAEGLRVVRAGLNQVSAMYRVKDGLGDFLVEQKPRTNQQSRSERLKHGVNANKDGGKNRQAKQGCLAATGNHAIINLQHIQRANK